MVNHASLLCIIGEAMKRYKKHHHVHIGSLFKHFYLNYVFNWLIMQLQVFGRRYCAYIHIQSSTGYKEDL